MAAKKEPSPGERMVDAILAEMTEAGVEPDAKERALLDTARQLVDRLDALERIIARDGEILTSPAGAVRVHPAVAEHRQQAATLPKVLSGIVVGDSSGIGKNPAKVRAAQVRWANRDRRRAAAAQSAGV
jgi:hypothetical protein